MRALWQRSHGGPMTEHDLRDVLAQLAAAPDAELDAWVHSTADLPTHTCSAPTAWACKPPSPPGPAAGPARERNPAG